MRFEIGQQVWWATCDTREHFETCPDCGGTGRLRVIFHDETQASIECRNCAGGYDPPTGRVKWYGRIPEARLITITGMEISGANISWQTAASAGCYYRIEDGLLFLSEADAKACAYKLAVEHDAAAKAKVLTKEKDAKTWAWNASYHRTCIRRAQKDLEYHTAKLRVAALKAKTPEASDAGV